MIDSPHFTPAAVEAAQAAQAYAEKISKALRISEIRYRRLFETARDGILLLDSNEGRVTDANPYMTELLGYTHEELIGKELWEIGLLADKASSKAAFQQLKRDNYIRYDDLPLENQRGERREVEFVSNLYREDDTTVIQCNIRDITDRRRAEGVLATEADRNERIAEILQRSMLLESPAGEFPGLEVETLYAAALREAHVGGDFFDAFTLDATHVALVVGDVSGKGLAAASRTLEVKYALRAFLHAYPVPEIAIEHLNDFICVTHQADTRDIETFIVLALAIVDTSTGQGTFSAAGAEPSLIMRGDGSVEFVELIGSPLGIIPGGKYESRTVQLGQGDVVLMATDGITEARHDTVFLGIDGMAAIAQKTGPTVTLAELSHAVFGGAKAFANGNLRDDVCLLVARRH